MANALDVPEGIGEKMWHTLIKLLAEQEGVEIKYDLVPKENGGTEDKTA